MHAKMFLQPLSIKNTTIILNYSLCFSILDKISINGMLALSTKRCKEKNGMQIWKLSRDRNLTSFPYLVGFSCITGKINMYQRIFSSLLCLEHCTSRISSLFLIIIFLIGSHEVCLGR